MRTLGVVTVGRADYGILLPILRRITADPDLALHLIVSGMHLAPEFGRTVSLIRDDGLAIGDQVEMLLASDTPEGIAKSMGLGTIGFAQSYARRRPDLLLVVGDRFEVHAAVSAALPFNIPVAHVHGGESTEGLIDEAIRHSITKMSHLHFASTQAYASRIIQMGEEPWRVMVSGAPSLDHLRTFEPMEPRELEEVFGVRLGEEPPLLVTYHPVTLRYERTAGELEELLEALDVCEAPVVFTMPNADTSHRLILPRIKAFISGHPHTQLVQSFGTQGYFSLMHWACAMVGNSSSGIIEAASFGLPVVNIGTRQQGRLHGPNVLDVEGRRDAISAAIQKARSQEFRDSVRGLPNLYGDGRASERIVGRLRTVELNDALLVKRWAAEAASEEAAGSDADHLCRRG